MCHKRPFLRQIKLLLIFQKMRRDNQRLQKVLFFILFMPVVLCLSCARDNPELLKGIKTPYKEYASYEHYGYGSKKSIISSRHKVIVVPRDLTVKQAYEMAWRFDRAYPGSTFDFFDDESQIEEYIRWDKKNNSEETLRYGKFQHDPGETLRKYRKEHRAWSIYPKREVGYKKAFLDKHGNRTGYYIK